LLTHCPMASVAIPPSAKPIPPSTQPNFRSILQKPLFSVDGMLCRYDPLLSSF
jgi:hypothetical protein